MVRDLSKLSKKINVAFTDPELLRQALVHRSYINENPGFNLEHNERLEFLGDAVLELVITEYLYEHYPNPEGELTNWRASLVNAQMLAKIAHMIDLEKYLYLSKGEAKDKNTKARNYILADAFEAVIGAIYLDRGYAASKQFILAFVAPQLPEILSNNLYVDPKSRFQELAQEKLKITPSYKVLDESGPDHDKSFEIGVYLDTELVATGVGSSKQEAQVAAAQKALKVKKWV